MVSCWSFLECISYFSFELVDVFNIFQLVLVLVAQLLLGLIYRVSQKICQSPGNSTLLFHDLVHVSDKRHNKCSMDSFIQILQLS